MKKYVQYIKPYAAYYFTGPLFMLVEVVGDIMLPWLLARIINVGVMNHDIGYIELLAYIGKKAYTQVSFQNIVFGIIIDSSQVSIQYSSNRTYFRKIEWILKIAYHYVFQIAIGIFFIHVFFFSSLVG